MTVSVDGVRGTAELLALIRAGARPGYLMFWMHRPPQGCGVWRSLNLLGFALMEVRSQLAEDGRFRGELRSDAPSSTGRERSDDVIHRRCIAHGGH
jgi:hypothetical protein